MNTPSRPESSTPRRPPAARKWWARWGPTPSIAIRRGGFKLILTVIGTYLIGMTLYQSIGDAVTHGIHRRGDLYTVSLRAMSDFDMDQVNGTTDDIPKPFRDLDGKRVMLAGQMWSPFGAAGRLNGFDLVYSISNCCFRGPPLVQHFVHATVGTSSRVEFMTSPVIVTGTLHVSVQREAGSMQSIYRLDVEDVQPN